MRREGWSEGRKGGGGGEGPGPLASRCQCLGRRMPCAVLVPGSHWLAPRAAARTFRQESQCTVIPTVCALADHSDALW